MKCDYCHGTGTRYDATCADNVNTDAQKCRPCPSCDATGIAAPKIPAPKREYAPGGEIPDWML